VGVENGDLAEAQGFQVGGEGEQLPAQRAGGETDRAAEIGVLGALAVGERRGGEDARVG